MSKLQEITAKLNSGNAADALKIAVTNPPYDADPASKQADVDAVLQVLTQFKEPQMADALKSLDSEQCDILMKYLYKGFETGVNSTTMFKWFSALQAKQEGGLGSIVRVLTDKKKL